MCKPAQPDQEPAGNHRTGLRAAGGTPCDILALTILSGQAGNVEHGAFRRITQQQQQADTGDSNRPIGRNLALFFEVTELF